MTEDELQAVELLAVELATLAGAEITAALSRALIVSYKGAPDSVRDPVSEVDRNVEVLIRTRLAEHFPDHGVLGEEIDEQPAGRRNIVWAVDPVDGTNNFINGFPWFSASVGVLEHGVPVVGALWCSTTHRLGPGVYHARTGAPLGLDGQPVLRSTNPQVRRRLAGYPGGNKTGSLPWDLRRTGSAALECACVAAGMLQVARFDGPFVWDVAGGVVLARAAGRAVYVRENGRWQPFERFGTVGPDGLIDVTRDWRRPMILGEPDAAEMACRLSG